MPLLKVTEVVEIFLIDSKKNKKAVEEIKDSILERVGYDYSDWVAVEWDEDIDDFNVISKEEYVREHQKADLLEFLQIEMLMLLIFKDDLHSLDRLYEQRKVQFLAHLVRGK